MSSVISSCKHSWTTTGRNLSSQAPQPCGWAAEVNVKQWGWTESHFKNAPLEVFQGELTKADVSKHFPYIPAVTSIYSYSNSFQSAPSHLVDFCLRVLRKSIIYPPVLSWWVLVLSSSCCDCLNSSNSLFGVPPSPFALSLFSFL